jgi:hypothetical protein
VGQELHSCLRARLALHPQDGEEEVWKLTHQQQLWYGYERATGNDVLQLLLYYAVCTSNSQLVHRVLDEGAHPNPSSSAGGIATTARMPQAPLQLQSAANSPAGDSAPVLPIPVLGTCNCRIRPRDSAVAAGAWC